MLYQAAEHLFRRRTVSRLTERAVQIFSGKYSDSDEIKRLLEGTVEITAPVDESLYTEAGIKEESPYTLFVAEAAEQADEYDAVEDHVTTEETIRNTEENAFFSPSVFGVISSVMHLIPLWSALMTTSDEEDPVVYSNAYVETHFKSIKKGVLQDRKRLRPRDFINKNLVYLNGKFKELRLPEIPRVVRRPKKLPKDKVEMWKKGRKSKKKYSDPIVAEKVFKKSAPRNQKEQDKSRSTEVLNQ